MADEQPPQAARRLTDEEQARVAAWYEQYGEEVVREVRGWLRRTTKVRTAASTSAVAGSVWASLMEKHLDEIDPDDPECAWRVLAESARRHCEAWNRYGTRHPQLSLEGIGAGAGAGGEGATGLDPENTRDPPPEVVVMAREIGVLFQSLTDPGERGGVGRAIIRVEPSLGLVERLEPWEREVLGLKLAKKTREEIAKLLRTDQTHVDSLWDAVKSKALALAGESRA